jgi:hypothetical protein
VSTWQNESIDHPTGWEQTVSEHVHRDGANKITVQDDDGREVVLISENRTLQLPAAGSGLHLTPQMAQDLADELRHWATCQQTICGATPRSARLVL